MKDRIRRYWREILVVALLSAATGCAFGSLLGAQFIKLDDGYYVVHNRQVLGGLSWGGLAWALRTGFQASWHPLTWLSHMLDVELYGLNPTGHHLTNLLLHWVNVLLLFALLRRLTGAVWRSAFVAALFGLHPLHVEAVAWVSSRKDLLSGCFFLLSLLAYVEYARAPAAERVAPTIGSRVAGRGVNNWYWVALACFACGLMSKAMVVSLPLVLLLLDFWPLRRLQLELAGAAELKDAGSNGLRAAALRLVREKLPFFILAFVLSVVTYVVMAHSRSMIPGLPLGPRLANAASACWFYLSKTIWPSGLALYYPYPALEYLHAHPNSPIPLAVWLRWPTLAGALLLVGLSAVAASRLRREPWLGFGWLWFLIMLGPVSGVVQVGDHAMADRYTYLPLVGIFVAVVWQAAEWARRFSAGHVSAEESGPGPAGVGAAGWMVGGVGLALVAGCFGATVRQVAYWHDDTSVFTHALAVTKDNALAHYELGIGLRDQRQTAAAAEQFRAAVKADRGCAPAYAELGLMLEQRGQTNDALGLYRTALAAAPWDAQIQNHLATLLWRAGQHQQALDHYWAAVRAKPDDADAHYNLGTCLAAVQRWEQAADQFNIVVRLRPKDADALGCLAESLLYEGHPALAEQRFREVIGLDPGNAQAHQHLAVLATSRNDLDEARRQFEQALKLRPDWPEALNGLAFVLATATNSASRDPAEAVKLAQRACELSGGRSPWFWGTLDTAYAQAGRFKEAIRAAEKARELALSGGQTNLAAAASTRIGYYRKGQVAP